MKRLVLFEFEDYPWLPEAIRTGATNLIMVLHRLMGTPSVIADLILNARSRVGFNQITDMGSGSGGPMIDAIHEVNGRLGDEEVRLSLSDLHPNKKLVLAINATKDNHVNYIPTSVDATKPGGVPNGLRTMIASFHHLSPVAAKKVLKAAQDDKQPILIYEIAKNNVPTLLWWLLLPLSLLILIVMTLVMTPFVRPLTVRQLLFTYIIPVIPIVYAWDGQASLMRTYTFEDVEELLRDFRQDDYDWKVTDALKSNGKKIGYYIIGLPVVGRR